MNPLFSIIVPTGGGRSHTLGATLRTALEHPGEDIEILLSDNDPTGSVQTIASKIFDPRFRQIKTARRLSMTDHWNFAIEKSKGELVMILGDDDGLMPDAITELRKAIATYEADVYFSALNGYQWPIDGRPGFISMRQDARAVQPVDLPFRARNILRIGGAQWASLPSVYQAFVRRSALEQMRERTGVFCDTMNPDVYAGFALAGIGARALRLAKPIAISGKSYGEKEKPVPNIMSGPGGETGVLAKHVSEFALPSQDFDLPKRFPAVVNSFAFSILQAITRFPENYGRIRLNMSAHYAWMASSRKIGDPADFWHMRSDLRARGFCFPLFLAYYWAFRFRHSRSARKIRRLASTHQAADIYTAAHLLKTLSQNSE